MTKKTKKQPLEKSGACLTSRLALLTAVVAMPLMLASAPGNAALFLKIADSPVEVKELVLLACANGSHIKTCSSLNAAVDFYLKKGGTEPDAVIDYFLKTNDREPSVAKVDFFHKQTGAEPSVAADYFLKKSAHNSISPAAVDYFLKIDGIGYKEGHKFQGFVLGADDGGHTIYKDKRGEFFYLDRTTGDKKFLPAESIPFKFKSLTSVIGVDLHGNVLRQGETGETFYLQPETGNKIFVKDFVKPSENPDASSGAIIAAEEAVMQMEVNIDLLAQSASSSIFDRWGNLKTENPKVVFSEVVVSSKTNLQLAKEAFADKDFNRASDLARASQAEAHSAGGKIEVFSWSWGTAKLPRGTGAEVAPKQNTAPADQKAERADRRDPGFDIPQMQMDVPTFSSPGGGGMP